MKVLIIRFSSIGDIVLCSPVIRVAKSAGAEVHFITKAMFQAVLMHNPNIDRLWTFEKEPQALLPDLKAQKFDAIIDLHHNLRSIRLSMSLGVPTHRFKKLNFRKWLMTNFKINILPNEHIVDRYMQAGSFLHLRNDLKGLDYFLSPDEQQEADDLLEKHGLKPLNFLAAVTGGAHRTKVFPAEKLNETLAHSKQDIVLLGGPSDAALAEQIKVSTAKCINLCGKVPLNVSAAIIKRARLVIANDTGLMHVAAAFQKPLISIWGNTIPEFGMTPYYGDRQTEHFMFQVKGLSCRPCSKIGYEECPKGHFKCMLNQDSGAISLQVNDLYQSSGV